MTGCCQHERQHLPGPITVNSIHRALVWDLSTDGIVTELFLQVHRLRIVRGTSCKLLTCDHNSRKKAPIVVMLFIIILMILYTRTDRPFNSTLKQGQETKVITPPTHPIKHSLPITSSLPTRSLLVNLLNKRTHPSSDGKHVNRSHQGPNASKTVKSNPYRARLNE